MEPQTLKENFASQLVRIEKEISQLQAALIERRELSLKLRGAVEAMQIQLGEDPDESAVVEEAISEQTEKAPIE